MVDAAIFDYAMREMNGVELAARARRPRPELPVLFITGHAEPNGLWDANAAGLVLRKPFKVGDLGARLTHIIGPISNRISRN